MVSKFQTLKTTTPKFLCKDLKKCLPIRLLRNIGSHNHGRGKGGREGLPPWILKCLAKKCYFLVLSGKKQISALLGGTSSVVKCPPINWKVGCSRPLSEQPWHSLGKSVHPKSPRQVTNFTLRPAANCRHQKFELKKKDAHGHCSQRKKKIVQIKMAQCSWWEDSMWKVTMTSSKSFLRL